MNNSWDTPMLIEVNFNYNRLYFTFRSNNPNKNNTHCSVYIPSIIEGKDHIYNNNRIIKATDMSIIMSAIKRIKLKQLLSGDNNENQHFNISINNNTTNHGL